MRKPGHPAGDQCKDQNVWECLDENGEGLARKKELGPTESLQEPPEVVR